MTRTGGAADPDGGSTARNRLRNRLFHLAALVIRPFTLGVRCAAFDAEGRIFLVRHTYVEGWMMPGGGVDGGETAETAVVREMQEEGNLVLAARPQLLGVFKNGRISARDHVLFFRADGVRQSAPRPPNWEIADSGFFALDALPEATSPATRRRLQEMAGEVEVDPLW